MQTKLTKISSNIQSYVLKIYLKLKKFAVHTEELFLPSSKLTKDCNKIQAVMN